MDRYDPYTDKLLRDTQYNILGTNLAEVGTDKNVGSNDDCISRRQAIEALGEQPLAWEHGEYEEGLIAKWESDMEAIKNLPPAQPETATVTIGRTRGGTTMWYECDNCGEPVDQRDNYCPNCGRKFRKNE